MLGSKISITQIISAILSRLGFVLLFFGDHVQRSCYLFERAHKSAKHPQNVNDDGDDACEIDDNKKSAQCSHDSCMWLMFDSLLLPNDQELSHAAGDSCQPKTRSENCQA